MKTPKQEMQLYLGDKAKTIENEQQNSETCDWQTFPDCSGSGSPVDNTLHSKTNEISD